MSTACFNCFGFKSSNDFVKNLCRRNDVCFISEHWLKVCDITYVEQCFNDENYWCSLKSSMDPEVTQRGRSYGGVGFICKKQNNISYRNVNVDSDRVSVVEVLYNHKTILTVVGVHMPFYNALADQIALYAETIDIVQNVLEIHSQCSPLMVMV